ncbi:hypothetical protein JB92DRAFT_2830437 [Gautieria morchelliformis]|nr:hypothetical protein JB92DRAFT_2830437 [Gautieria morchelliformis]
MHSGTAPVAGPSKRSYAQVVKDSPPPCTELRPEIIQSDQLEDHCEEGWTDVSSVTSCDWPGSVDEELVGASDQSCTSNQSEVLEAHRNYSVHEPTDEALWIDHDVDTRAPHALACHIKRTNRSRWLYTNVRMGPCRFPTVEEDIKSWRRYPVQTVKECTGYYTASWERDLTTKSVAAAQRVLEKEIRTEQTLGS